MIRAKTYSRHVAAAAAAPTRFRFEDLLIVLVVVAIGLFAVKQFMSTGSESSLDTQAKSFLKTDLAAALTSYKNDTGSYPSTRQSLKALVEQPANVANWKGPYVSAEALMDPWKMPYQYSFPGRHNAVGQYDSWSMGSDKMSATSDDVGNW